MRLGSDLTFDPGWQPVEDDLYHVAERVQEYDKDALLVREVGTGRLGIAHFNKFDGCHTLAAVCKDPSTREWLRGCPDGRVLRFMRIADGHSRIHNIDTWVRMRRDGIEAERQAWKDQYADMHREYAKEAVWRRNRVDLGGRPSTFIS
jgi:hypothetical protein